MIIKLTRKERKLLLLVAEREMSNNAITFYYEGDQTELEVFSTKHQKTFDSLRDKNLVKGGISQGGWIMLTANGKEYLKTSLASKGEFKLWYLIASIIGAIAGLITIWIFVFGS